MEDSRDKACLAAVWSSDCWDGLDGEVLAPAAVEEVLAVEEGKSVREPALSSGVRLPWLTQRGNSARTMIYCDDIGLLTR